RVREPDAADGGRGAEQRFLIRAVEVDVALERVAAGPAVDAILEPVERDDAGEDQIVGPSLALPDLARGLAALEHGARLGALPDPALPPGPARRAFPRAPPPRRCPCSTWRPVPPT